MPISIKIRYIIGGLCNTLFGYFISLGLYQILSTHIHIIFIALFANILAITFAFLMYKLFVFQTKGNWINEYLKSYLVYGATAIFGTVLLWGLVDFLKIPFWLSQLGVMIVSIVISFMLHRNFTFSTLYK
jgi:putative flippase GtrA